MSGIIELVRRARSRGCRLAGLALLSLVAAAAVGAQDAPAPLPFGVGERLTYRVSVGRLGEIGRGSMLVEGPQEVRDQQTYLLRFDFQTRVGPVRVMDRTQSWLDPRRMASLRFVKQEKHPLSSRTQSVELYPDERRWLAADGESGGSPTDAPLDELSFIYYIRTLPLTDGAEYQVNRHFEADRNPVTIRVIRHERLTVPAGEFPTILVEMRVKDPDHYKGEGVIRLNLTDDACRIPVRIESAVPRVGTMVLRLESLAHPQAHLGE